MGNVSVEHVGEIIERHGRNRESLLPILRDTVEAFCCLEKDTMRTIAEELDISLADVYGTATFYEFLPMAFGGRNTIRICKNISCHMEGKGAVVAAIEQFLQTKLGERSQDGEFAFLSANCLGWCHKGPAMLVNEQPYTELTPKTAIDTLRAHMR